MKNRKHARRVKRLALICTMCTIILVVSTYAWFIGMKTVNVSTFDVEIAATDGLSLSLNGKDWAETVSISKETYSDASKATGANAVYAGNTNTWGGTGLVPISTVGEISATDSRLIMYEKGSLTTTPGGYRLMASKVDNTKATTGTGEEGTGFVSFDLFVRNLSGDEYYWNYNQLNEEAIYLNHDSEVKVVTTGSDDQELTGIENSVRVAFAQIGRVEAVKGSETADIASSVQGITCTTTASESQAGVTGICDRYAQIWEPNDTAHVENAINWYETACRVRTGDTVTKDESYVLTDDVQTSDKDERLCKTVANGTYVQTYAVGNVINYTDNIDVYDGVDYNGYTSSIKNYDADTSKYSYIDAYSTIANGASETVKGTISTSTAGLYAYDYFRDSEKLLTGMDRPTFMTLAPNSITKIRVYVYIEGQDVDNYDFASLGKKISVSFGFTKERFFGSDINYQGPTGVPTTPESAS